jgi:hypothetical protein
MALIRPVVTAIMYSARDGEELVEVTRLTLDLQDEDTIVLRSIEPAAAAFGVAEDAESMARRPRRRWRVVLHFARR